MICNVQRWNCNSQTRRLTEGVEHSYFTSPMSLRLMRVNLKHIFRTRLMFRWSCGIFGPPQSAFAREKTIVNEIQESNANFVAWNKKRNSQLFLLPMPISTQNLLTGELCERTRSIASTTKSAEKIVLHSRVGQKSSDFVWRALCSPTTKRRRRHSKEKWNACNTSNTRRRSRKAKEEKKKVENLKSEVVKTHDEGLFCVLSWIWQDRINVTVCEYFWIFRVRLESEDWLDVKYFNGLLIFVQLENREKCENRKAKKNLSEIDEISRAKRVSRPLKIEI